MRKLALILFLLPSVLSAQVTLTIEGQTKIDSINCDVGYGVTFPRTVPTTFLFKNNYVQTCNIGGYMLEAGFESPSAYTNNLHGEQIIGNHFNWVGNQDANTITHGIFTGYNTDVKIMYNYLNYVPMGIIRKSNGMTDTAGVVAYNIIRNSPAVGVVVKGMNGVRIYNNTFYSEDSLYVGPGIGTWRGLIDVYKNDSPVADAKYVKIKNNIFYTKNRIINVNVMDTACLQGFECDYNTYWCETGEPMFRIAGVDLTLTQWRQRGYDIHSQLRDPYFIDTESLVPSWRVEWGTPTEFNMGIAANARWVVGQDLPLVAQNGLYWQQGARVYEGGMVIFYEKGYVISGDTINIPLKTGKVFFTQGEIIIQQ
jgi:hypothetical protein